MTDSPPKVESKLVSQLKAARQRLLQRGGSYGTNLTDATAISDAIVALEQAPASLVDVAAAPPAKEQDIPTPIQLAWLKHLQRLTLHVDRWHRMPKNARGVAASNRTWGAMQNRGWITAEFRDDGVGNLDWHFTITDEGMRALRAAG